MKPIDISPEDLKTVRAILRRHLPDIEVRAFGSRVRWTARGSSDLDLVLMTEDAIDAGSMADLREAFVESDLSFKVDLVDWATTSDEFRRVIEEECEVVQEANMKSMGRE
ncbi:MAG: nucleotidyltransferase domain-containing protein [Euryarchaeota archaeon]|nr:nucleotidyltransferase domain-containing protein [Euryarchaeota archaeon]